MPQAHWHGDAGRGVPAPELGQPWPPGQREHRPPRSLFTDPGDLRLPAVTLSQALLAHGAQAESQYSVWGPDPGIWPPLEGTWDVSCALQCPCRGCWGLGGAPSSSLWVSPCPLHRVLGDTETGWLCIFTPQYFIDILQQTGSESRVHAFPWEGRPFCPLGEGNNHMVWRGGC